MPSKDKKDWMNFIKEMDDVRDKEVNLNKQNQEINKTRKLYLHGNSLTEANKIVRKFIIESFNKGERKLLIVTGKGSRSKSYENPYVSEKLSVLKYSIPDYIKNDKTILEKSPLEQACKNRNLSAYKFKGFWKCMDTLRDKIILDKMWNEKKALWKK